jgi:hypothetical protein
LTTIWIDQATAVMQASVNYAGASLDCLGEAEAAL